MFTAFIAMLAFIPPIPLPFIPVPIAFQNTGIMLAGCLLGYKRGTLSVVIFLLVAVGLPILTGGRRIRCIFGPSAGYILGYPYTFLLVTLSI